MREDRLRKLIEVMEAVEEREDVRRKFDMGHWFSRWHEPNLFEDIGQAPINPDFGYDEPWKDCGTAACALGWFVSSPQAAADGWAFIDEAYRYNGTPFSLSAREYFEINSAAFNFLFLPSAYSDDTVTNIMPWHVIGHVEALIDGLAPRSCYECAGATRRIRKRLGSLPRT